MPTDSELAQLFSNVPGILNQVTDWNGGTTPPPSDDGLAAFPEHGGVTDDQVAAWLSQRTGQRLGPAPVVNNQSAPTQPQFLPGQGQHTPPPGGLEGGDGGQGGQNAPVVPGRVEPTAPQGQPSAPQPTPPIPAPLPSEQQPPSPTGSPISPATAPQAGQGAVPPVPPPVPADYIEFNGQQIPRSKLESWIAFQQAVDTDPDLQRTLRQIQTGTYQSPQPYPGYPPVQQYEPPNVPGPFSVPQYNVPPGQQNAPYQQYGQYGQQQPQQPGQLPQLSAEDLADPTINALYSMLQQQQSQIQSVSQAAMVAQQVAIERAQQEQAATVQRVAAEYQTTNNLSAEQMNQVYGIAGRLNVLPSLFEGIDPITNLPCPRDPAYAVRRTFDIAASQVPELQQRNAAAAQQRQQQDEEHQRKLSALSGSSGSAPRTTPAPRNAAERSTALNGEVAAMLNGTWSDPSATN